jgi:hypothetical protein
MKHLSILTLAAATACLSLAGCYDELDGLTTEGDSEGTITVTFGIELGECTPTRGDGTIGGGYTTDPSTDDSHTIPADSSFVDELYHFGPEGYTYYDSERELTGSKASGASIYILAFDMQHLLTDIYECTYYMYQSATNQYFYKATLNKSTQPRYFHIVVGKDFDPDNVPLATESDIFNSTLMRAKNTDVYWRRLYLNDVQDDVVGKYLSGVKLIRNYARVKLSFDLVESSKYKASDFAHVEWCMMNVPTMSYVAPYLKEQEFASYFKEDGTQATYDDLYEEGYRCHVPRTTSNKSTYYTNTTAADAEKLWTKWYHPLYTYENEGSSESDLYRRTALLIRATKTDSTIWYYRLNLVDPDRNNEQLYLMRNVSYEVKITSINEAGYTTVGEAFSRAAANNISGSASTSTFTNVSTNNASLRVEYMTKYIFSADSVTMNFRYVPNVTKLDDNNNYVSENESVELTTAEAYTGTAPDFKGTDSTQYAIADYSIAKKDNSGSNYRKITFKPNTPQKGGISTTSKIRVRVNDEDNPTNNSLYRDVTFVLRNRYLMKNMTITRDDVNTYTLTVDIPSGLPQEIFPLDFTFETYPPFAYPNANRSIMRVSGTDESLFNGKYDSFHYHRAVTWDIYQSFNAENGYTQVTFYFHTITENLPTEDSTIVMFAVYEPSFSPAPDKQIDRSRPWPLFGAFSFKQYTSSESETSTSTSSTSITDPEFTKKEEYTDEESAYNAWYSLHGVKDYTAWVDRSAK